MYSVLKRIEVWQTRTGKRLSESFRGSTGEWHVVVGCCCCPAAFPPSPIVVLEEVLGVLVSLPHLKNIPRRPLEKAENFLWDAQTKESCQVWPLGAISPI